jgi:photosystem II stability/assembly factor-like uncharacterized protein
MVMDLAFSPDYSHDQTIFAGNFAGGIFVSTDGGDTWQASNAGLPALTVMSIAISPDFRSDQTIFLGVDDNGVFVSSDGGNSWNSSNNGFPYSNYRFVKLSPSFPEDRTLYAAYSYVYQSNDGGATWSQLGTLIWNRYVTSLEVSSDNQILYATTDGEGIFCMKIR